MAFCSNCGTELNDGAKFCPNCGTQLDGMSGTKHVSNPAQGEPKKKMALWKKIVIGFIIFAIIGALSQPKDGKTKSNNETNAPQKTEKVSDDSKKAQEEQARQVKEEAERQAREEKNKQEKAKQEESVLGTYEITDKVGCSIRITLNEDKTATITGTDGNGKSVTFYCKWDDFRRGYGGIRVWYGSTEKTPYLVFDGGDNVKKNMYNPGGFLKDGWFYVNLDEAESKDPNWRLKATKIK